MQVLLRLFCLPAHQHASAMLDRQLVRCRVVHPLRCRVRRTSSPPCQGPGAQTQCNLTGSLYVFFRKKRSLELYHLLDRRTVASTRAEAQPQQLAMAPTLRPLIRALCPLSEGSQKQFVCVNKFCPHAYQGREPKPGSMHDMYLHSHRLGTGQRGPQASFSS
jgi:hypothetical protein